MQKLETKFVNLYLTMSVRRLLRTLGKVYLLRRRKFELIGFYLAASISFSTSTSNMSNECTLSSIDMSLHSVQPNVCAMGCANFYIDSAKLVLLWLTETLNRGLSQQYVYL